MRPSDRMGWAYRRVALLVLGIAALVGPVPAQAAFPGKPGPIAYQKYDAEELEYTGGLFAHGPRQHQAPRQLTDNPGDGSPSYSPDGRKVVFSGNRDPSTGDFPPPSGGHIYVMDSDGSDVRQLTTGNFYDDNPAFSPDGKSVVFDRANYSLARVTHIYSVGVDGSGLRQITDTAASDYDPTFTPNGRRIVFVSNRRSSGRKDRSNIFSMRPNGSHVRFLIGGSRSESTPDVSPNGRRIAFSSSSRGKFGIYIARMSGRHVRALRESQGASNPAWAPDGKHIAFLRWGSRSSEVLVMRSDGRGYSKEFDSGSTEEEGFGSQVGAPGWGARPR